MAITTLTGVNGTVSIAGVNVPVIEFTIAIRRNTIIQPRLDKFSDKRCAGKVSVSGSVTLTDISGLQIARLMNTTPTSPVPVGAADKFTLYGEVVDNYNQVRIQAENCFFTESLARFQDADTYIYNQLLFDMENPDSGLTLYYAETLIQTVIHNTNTFIYGTEMKTHTTDSLIWCPTKTHTTDTYIYISEDFMTTKNGTATITAESTYVTITHNAGSLPTMYIISPYGQVGAWYITDRTTNSFRLNISEPQPVSIDFGWGIVY